MNKLLVLGIGNMLLTDDGVGVFASQELMKEDWPEQVTIREGGTFTQDIFYSFKGYSHLLVLGVEPKNYVTWNIGLSDDVRAVFPEFLALARKEIGEWLKRYGNGETRA